MRYIYTQGQDKTWSYLGGFSGIGSLENSLGRPWVHSLRLIHNRQKSVMSGIGIVFVFVDDEN